MKNYGEILRELRLSRGLTLKDIENYTGINNGNMSRWERGENLPSIYFCEQLAEFYGITLDELVGGIDPINKVSPSPTAPQLSAEDKNLLSAYHGLDRPLQSLLWDMIRTWQKNSASSFEEAPKKKA